MFVSRKGRDTRSITKHRRIDSFAAAVVAEADAAAEDMPAAVAAADATADVTEAIDPPAMDAAAE